MTTITPLAAASLPAPMSAPGGHEAGLANADARANDAARFTAFVEGAAGENNFSVAPAAGRTPISAAVGHQSDLFTNMLDAVQKGQIAARTGTSEEMSAASIDLMLKASMSSMHFNASTSLIQSVKNGVQTLMKNQ
jgi:hypothetical protein